MTLITGRDLAVKVIEQVTRHPETHNQSLWMDFCGTAGCLAGWAVAFNRQRGENSFHTKRRIAAELRPVDAMGHVINGSAGMYLNWSEAGAALFGFLDDDGRLDEEQADRIFMCMDERHAVHRLALHFDIELPEGYTE